MSIRIKRARQKNIVSRKQSNYIEYFVSENEKKLNEK